MRHLVSFLSILLVLVVLSSALEFLRGLLEGPVIAEVAGQKGGMLALNITTVIQAVGYIVFIKAMDVVLYRPMLAHLDARRTALEEAEAAADEAARATRKVKREREAKLAEAFREATRERGRIKAGAVEDYQKIVQDARKAADEKYDESRESLEKQADEAERTLEGDVDELAGLIRQKLTGEGARP